MKKTILTTLAAIMMSTSAFAADSVLTLVRGIGEANLNLLESKVDISIPSISSNVRGLATRVTDTPEVVIANTSGNLRAPGYNGNFGVRIEYNQDIAYQVVKNIYGRNFTITRQDHAARHEVVQRNNRDNNLNIVINEFTGQSSFNTEGEGSATLTNDTVFINGTQQDVTAISAIILDEMQSNPDFDKDVFQEHIVDSLDGGVFSSANFARALRSPAGSMR